jgi:tight adherence protein B
LADRRRRVALLDILSGLRMLARELRAGAEPGTAAANSASAAKGDGADVLAGLAQLTRSDDRPSTQQARADRWGRAAIADPTQLSADNPPGPTADANDPAAWTASRLRSGWLLTRRHGLAFTPLIDALVQELAERVQADAERSGQVAGPRMSGFVMALLPLLGLALGAGMGADPVQVLLRSTVGNILLLVGIGLTCAGLLWSARIVRR